MQISEVDVGNLILRAGSKYLEGLTTVDVAVVGAGPSGLVASRYMARAGLRVLVVERRFSPGGGIGSGGNMFPTVVVQEEALPILREFGVSTRESSGPLYAVDAAELLIKLSYGALDAGVRILLGANVDDVIVRGDPPRVSGILWTWTPIQVSGMHVDPLYIESRAVLDATGHDAEVVSIASRKNPGLGIRVQGESSCWADEAERLVVERTGRVAPGLYVTGMAVGAVHGLPRMGPIFGGMLLSGKRAAEIIARDLGAVML
ncbi:MAG: sulfide-dependent adenosine diphosphate thiazole synthase [Conexivisphaera sp.]